MNRKTLNRNQLKYLAALAMLVDHIAWAFVPTASVPGELMHIIGRLTAPIMLFFLVEGYVHTRSLRRYAGRIALFTLLSWVPCALFEKGVWPYPYFGMLWTILLGLAALRAWDQDRHGMAFKIAVVFALCALSMLGDWSVYGILLPLVFLEFREREKEKWRVYLLACGCFAVAALLISGPRQVFQFGGLLAPLLLKCYNGERGSAATFHKWFFYVFYPAHLLLLWWLTTVI